MAEQNEICVKMWACNILLCYYYWEAGCEGEAGCDGETGCDEGVGCGGEAGCAFISALRTRFTTGFWGSLVKTFTVLVIKPILPFISIVATIFPSSPGFRRLELATTAAHPQPGWSLCITSSSLPLFLKSNVCSIFSVWVTVPKSKVSVLKTIEGCEKEMVGKRSININTRIFFIQLYYNISLKKETPFSSCWIL